MISANKFMISSFKNVFILYLLISTNFLANLFGCKTQYAFQNNMILKHLLGFMTMYFFVVLVEEQSDELIFDTPGKQLLLTIFFYIMFIVSTRMDFKWWVALIIILSIFYILQVYKKHKHTNEEEKKKYEKYQIYLIYVMAIILIFGFLIYYGRKKIEYKNKFKISTFLLGKTKCADDKPSKINDYDAILKVFN